LTGVSGHGTLIWKKEKEAEMLSKSSPFQPDRPEPRDQIFNLPLPTLVEGRDALGKLFKEKTVLYYISHRGASFNLGRPIALGEKLKLMIDLPPSLGEEANLKLIINGKVALVETNNSHPAKQRISVRFDHRYFIKSDG
jgi:hypothetical protein